MEGLGEVKIAPRWADLIWHEVCQSGNQEELKRRLENGLKAFEDAAVENFKENSKVNHKPENALKLVFRR